MYAIHHPERVRALFLRGIFLCRRSELLWFYQVRYLGYTVFRIWIRFLRIRIQGFFLNSDPVPDPGKEETFRKAIQKNLGVPTSTVLIYLYIWICSAEWLPIFHMND